MESRIEVCMGRKCKRLGAKELMAELEKKAGIEGAVVGCKCMGKCKEGPNVRVVIQRAEDGTMKVAKGPSHVRVGLEDAGPIVAGFLGEITDIGPLAG